MNKLFKKISDAVNSRESTAPSINQDAIVKLIEKCGDSFVFFFDGKVVVDKHYRLCIVFEDNSVDACVKVHTKSGTQTFFGDSSGYKEIISTLSTFRSRSIHE